MEGMGGLTMPDTFWEGKRVFITGHTGFKGAWLCKILSLKGAQVTGYGLEPPTTPNLFEIAQISKNIVSITGDIRNYDKMKETFFKVKPEIVFHLAAQPLVIQGYHDPLTTYETNIMGTVNVLECVRSSDSVVSVINITTDKVYENKEWVWGYRESDILNGYDPYSNSKSCSDIVTQSYNKAFFKNKAIAVSTARAGNVIGGGDFADNRIIPDCIRAAINKERISIRNPYSIRPYQHVLEPLYAYMMIARKQYSDVKYAGCYNVGPDELDCFTTGKLVDLFCSHWGDALQWESCSNNGPHEANFLKLDCSKIKNTFGWRPNWNLNTAVLKTIEWTKCWINHGAILDCMHKQIQEFEEASNVKNGGLQ